MQAQPKLEEAFKDVMRGNAIYAAAILSSRPFQFQFPFSIKPALDKTAESIAISAQSHEIAQGICSFALPQPFFGQEVAITIWKSAQVLRLVTEADAEFNKLAATWKTDRRATSSTSAIAMHPAYQKIIGMGKQVVPFILADLQHGVDHWFWALRSITCENPVSPESRGNMQQMANAWLDWGRKNGYI